MSASPYKHSTAHVLHQLGLIASPEAHPDCKDLRGADEASRMSEAMRRPKRLAKNGHNLGKNDGITYSPRGYAAFNADIVRSHGIMFQLAEGKRKVETKS